MTQEMQHEEERGPLPRTREVVDWWLKKWGRQAVIDGLEPLNRQDVERLIEVNNGTPEGLYLYHRDMSGIDLGLGHDKFQGIQIFDLWGAVLADSKLTGANLGFANLKNADLARADLSHANLFATELQRANMFGANLVDANLEEAKLQGTRL